MKKRNLFLALGAAALACVVIVGAVCLKTPRKNDLESILAHGELVTEQLTEELELVQYIYSNSDYAVYGQEVRKLLSSLDERLPNQLSYAANGTDFDRYAPKKNAVFDWGLMWVTPQNELIRLVLASTDMTGDPALLVKLSVERNALSEVKAEVTERTEDAVWVKTDAQTEPVQILWDCEGTHLTNPVNKMEFEVGDEVTLWLNTESNENANGNCVLIAKAK